MRGASGLERLEHQLGGHCDRRAKGEIDRAFLGEKTMNPGGRFPLGFGCSELQPHMNPPDHQDVVLQLDFTDGFRDETIVRCRNLARLQRASKGAGESAGGGGDNVVQGGRVFLERSGRQLVMRGHGAVRAEDHRFAFGGQVRPANGPLDPFESDFGAVHHFSHGGHLKRCIVPPRRDGWGDGPRGFRSALAIGEADAE